MALLEVGEIMNLPSKEQYETMINTNSRWSEPKFQCPKCDGGMCKDTLVTLASYPAQYIYQCNKCGHVEHLYG